MPPWRRLREAHGWAAVGRDHINWWEDQVQRQGSYTAGLWHFITASPGPQREVQLRGATELGDMW